MAVNKEKIQFFIWGTLTGLIIAGSFFIFKLDDYFEKMKLYKNITKTFYLRPDKDKPIYELNDPKTEKDSNSDTEQLKHDTDKKEKKKPEADKSALNSEDNTSSSALMEDSLSATNFSDDDIEAIVIQKDELIESTTVQIIDLSPMTDAEKTSDSVLQKISGIRDDRTVTKKNIALELWKSPLNYKGYKMSKNKLVLYGFASIEGIKIFKLDDVTYMKLVSSVYKLDQTYDYKSYQHVDDSPIINKLK
jgi:hypothetical protein